MTSSFSCNGVLVASVTKLALILPHWEKIPTPITRARDSSPSVIKQDDKRKQSPFLDFFKSSDSPVSADSLDLTTLLSNTMASAGIESPA